MQSNEDFESLSSEQWRHCLQNIVEEIETRITIWKYPSSIEEEASQDDPSILEKRKYVVFGRPLQETFQRYDLERMLTSMNFRYPKISKKLRRLSEALANLIPTAPHVTLEELDEILVTLAELAFKIKLIAEEIPHQSTISGRDEQGDKIAKEKLKRSSTNGDDEPTNASYYNSAMERIIAVLTGGISDERIEQAARISEKTNLTANKKLYAIDELIPIPATTSAEKLGEMLKVSKQAVLKTGWWQEKQAGKQDELINRRQEVHRNRSNQADFHNSDK